MEKATEHERPRSRRQKIAKAAGYIAAYGLVALPASAYAYDHVSETRIIAGHKVEISPTFDDYATIDTGAASISLRYPLGSLSPLKAGVHVEAGRAVATSYDQLLERYALIASHPEGEIATATEAWKDMAMESILYGGIAGAVPLAIWGVIGASRRKELMEKLASSKNSTRMAVGAAVAITMLPTYAMPAPQIDHTSAPQAWETVADRFPQAPDDPKLQKVEISDGLLSGGAEKLVAGAISTYEQSQDFYSKLIDAIDLVKEDIHQPDEDETVAVLVSDRHDNIGMDKPARHIGDVGGATIVVNAGDDTSTGAPWEQFSLNSVNQSFKGYSKIHVSGNHDYGEDGFVARYFKSKGWEELAGKPKLIDGIRFLGSPDPRTSSLGNWRTPKHGTIADQSESLADTACAADEKGERISTLVTHDRNAARETLARGCVDLALSGHLHRQVGPENVIGENGKTGTTYTNGTTGGAAFAIALGSKIRREAEVTLITYKDGLPVGVQPVTINTGGEVDVQPYISLDFSHTEPVLPKVSVKDSQDKPRMASIK